MYKKRKLIDNGSICQDKGYNKRNGFGEVDNSCGTCMGCDYTCEKAMWKYQGCRKKHGPKACGAIKLALRAFW